MTRHPVAQSILILSTRNEGCGGQHKTINDNSNLFVLQIVLFLCCDLQTEAFSSYFHILQLPSRQEEANGSDFVCNWMRVLYRYTIIPDDHHTVTEAEHGTVRRECERSWRERQIRGCRICSMHFSFLTPTTSCLDFLLFPLPAFGNVRMGSS